MENKWRDEIEPYIEYDCAHDDGHYMVWADDKEVILQKIDAMQENASKWKEVAANLYMAVKYCEPIGVGGGTMKTDAMRIYEELENQSI